ncbi:hypothetical protein [Pendulispora albinea]|uniref:Uncharacterized protein n=1 Tax=Pendulispora albinea TaxID=2741071 RepID=A0ABZ2LQU5_9BACT
MRKTHRLWLLAGVLVLAACAGSSIDETTGDNPHNLAQDGNEDGNGDRPDAAVIDSGAGPVADGGVVVDGGPAGDGGVIVDGGPAADGGVVPGPDAGRVDSGAGHPWPPRDAGAPIDSGAGEPWPSPDSGTWPVDGGAGPWPVDGGAGPWPVDGGAGPWPVDGGAGPWPVDGGAGPDPSPDAGIPTADAGAGDPQEPDVREPAARPARYPQ